MVADMVAFVASQFTTSTWDVGAQELCSVVLINLSSQAPHLMGATLSTLLRAVHPGTIAMTDFRQRLRPKVLTRHLGDL